MVKRQFGYAKMRHLSLATLFRFLEPGELLEGVPEHAVFQRFWKDARADSFAPPPKIAARRASKLR